MFKNKFVDLLLKSVSYILVAAVASAATAYLILPNMEVSKLSQLEALIQEQFIGDADVTVMQDAAASAMVDSLGDRWSYYISADDYEAHMEQMQNAYVGIGITIGTKAVEEGFYIQQVEPGGGAQEAGIQPGDILTEVEGQRILDLGVEDARNLIRGKENTPVKLTVQREGERLEFTVIRKLIQVVVAKGEMLEGNIGLVTIANFDERCASETLAQVKTLVEQGAKALIFDVRFNPGGYKKELVEILDYLLPEGTLFRSQLYTGEESVDTSDAKCLEMPMAVLINKNSFSAAEFFAAALHEYDWAVLVGEATTGKSYFQSTFRLNDGSAVGLSIGKYFTPEGVSLAEVGGLKPDVSVPVDDELAAKIYADMLTPAEDPQIQAAIEALK